MKTVPTIMTIEEIFKLAKEKFTDIPEKDKKDFYLEKKDLFLFITLTNEMYTTICLLDSDITKDNRKQFINNNEVEYIVLKYDNEIYSNITFIVDDVSNIDYRYILNQLEKIHYSVYKKNYSNKYR